MKKDIKLMTAENFSQEYISDLPPDISVKKTSIQAFEIQKIREFLKFPTKLHRTTFSYLIFVTAGTAVKQLDLEVKKVTANQVLLIQQGHITSSKAMCSEIKGYFILFENDFINNYLALEELVTLFSSFPLIAVPESESGWLSTLCGLIVVEMSRPSPSIAIAGNLLKSALLKIISWNECKGEHATRYNDISFKFKELVHVHHVQQKLVSFYADKLNISENYLNRCVKYTMGKPPKEYITEVSIAEAQISLQNMTKDISEIAFELNYEDPSYFGRLFKKLTSYTPSEYRSLLSTAGQRMGPPSKLST